MCIIYMCIDLYVGPDIATGMCASMCTGMCGDIMSTRE